MLRHTPETVVLQRASVVIHTGVRLLSWRMVLANALQMHVAFPWKARASTSQPLRRTHGLASARVKASHSDRFNQLRHDCTLEDVSESWIEAQHASWTSLHNFFVVLFAILSYLMLYLFSFGKLLVLFHEA